MKIILDTNQICQNLRLEGVSYALLREFINGAKAQLLIPRVVLEELRRHIADDVASELAEVKAKCDKLTRKTGMELLSPDARELLREEGREQLFHRVEEGLAQFGAAIAELPQIDHSELLSVDLDGRRPFGKDGKGYRDALIWCSVIEAARTDDQVVFVSSDKGAFAEGCPEKLHPDLGDWLSRRGLSAESARVYNSLEDFTRQVVETRYPELKEKVLIQHGQHPLLDLAAVEGSHRTEILERLRDTVEQMHPDAERAESVNLDLMLSRFDVSMVRSLPQDRILVRAKVVYSGIVSYISFRIVDDVTKWSLNLTNRDVEPWLQVDYDIDMAAEVSLMLEQRNGSVEEFEVGRIEFACQPLEEVPPDFGM